MNSKSRSFQFDAYSELIHSKLMFTKVMSQQDKKTGVLFPIPFEKDRIDFINSIFIKDKHRFIQLAMRDINGNKYFIIDDKKRFDLKWLYPKQHMNTLSSKVAVKKASPINIEKKFANKKLKKSKDNDSLVSKTNNKKMRQKLKDPQAVKWYMMSKEERIRLSGDSNQKMKKVAPKKRNTDVKSEDAMNYRVSGSFGTGKRR